MDTQAIRDAEEDEEIIRRNLVYLTQKTSNYHDLIIHLLQEGLISNSERQNLEHRYHDDATKYTELFTTVCRRSDWLPRLCPILRKTGNDHVAERILFNSNILRDQDQNQGSSTVCFTRQLSMRKESSVLVEQLRKIDYSIGKFNVKMDSFQTQFNTQMTTQEKMETERNRVFFELATVIEKLGNTNYRTNSDENENLAAQKENLGLRYRNINSDLDKQKPTVEKLKKKLVKCKRRIRELIFVKEELEAKILANSKDYREEKKRIMEANELLILELTQDLSVVQTENEVLYSEIQTMKSQQALEAENSTSGIRISHLETKLQKSKEFITVLKTQIELKKRKLNIDELEFQVFTVRLNESPSPMLGTIDAMLMVTAEDILDQDEGLIYEQVSRITKFVDLGQFQHPRQRFILTGPLAVNRYTELPTDDIRTIEWTNCEVDSKTFLSILERCSKSLELIHLDQIRFHGKLDRRIEIPNLTSVGLNMDDPEKDFDTENDLESLIFFYREKTSENIFESKISFDLVLNGRRVFKVDWNNGEIVRCSNSKAFLGYGAVSASFGLKELTLCKATNFNCFENSSDSSLITRLNLIQVRLSREQTSFVLLNLPGLTDLRLHLTQRIFLGINSIPSSHLKTMDLCNISLIYSCGISFKNLESLRLDVTGMAYNVFPSVGTITWNFPIIFPSVGRIELFDSTPNSLENIRCILHKIQKMKTTHSVILYSVNLNLLREVSDELGLFQLPDRNNLDVVHVKLSKDSNGQYSQVVTVSEDTRDESLLDKHGFDKSFIYSTLKKLRTSSLAHVPVSDRLMREYIASRGNEMSSTYRTQLEDLVACFKNLMDRGIGTGTLLDAAFERIQYLYRIGAFNRQREHEHEICQAIAAATEQIPALAEILLHHQVFDRFVAFYKRLERDRIHLAEGAVQRPTKAEVQRMHQSVFKSIAECKEREEALRRAEPGLSCFHSLDPPHKIVLSEKVRKLQIGFIIRPPPKLKSQLLNLDERLWTCHICRVRNMSNKLKCIGCSGIRRSPSGHVELDFRSRRAHHFGQPYAFSLSPRTLPNGRRTLNEGPTFPLPGELEMGQWACEACTFVNTVYTDECEMCGGIREHPDFEVSNS